MISSQHSPRLDILRELKMRGGASQAELAETLGVSPEAVRQQMVQLEAQGRVRKEKSAASGRGRPPVRWVLTRAGEETFPRFYDALTIALIGSVGEKLGDDALARVLEDITDRQVDAWRPKLEGKPLERRMEALRGIYFDEDPYTTVERDSDGAMLVEHNCPYLSAAMEEPRLCSVTISTLKRLLGVEVERTKRFQQGDGRCVFRIRETQPVGKSFRFDWEE